MTRLFYKQEAGIAQLGERQTEDLKAGCSIHNVFRFCFLFLDSLAWFVPIEDIALHPFSS